MLGSSGWRYNISGIISGILALYFPRTPEPSEIFSAFFKQQFQRQTILNQVSQLPRTLSQLKGAQLPGREAEEVDVIRFGVPVQGIEAEATAVLSNMQQDIDTLIAINVLYKKRIKTKTDLIHSFKSKSFWADKQKQIDDFFIWWYIK